MKRVLWALAATLAFAVGSAAQAVALTPTLTADVSDSGGSLDYLDSGSSSPWPYLTVNWQDQWQNYGLLQFDLGAYSNVSTGELHLYHEFNAGIDASFALYRNTSPWIGTTTTWATRPSFDLTPVATLEFVGGTYSENTWYTLDVSSAVAGWTSGAFANYGFTLARTDAPNPFLYFAGNSSGFDPQLVISAVAEPSTYAMLLGGLALTSFVLRRRRR